MGLRERRPDAEFRCPQSCSCRESRQKVAGVCGHVRFCLMVVAYADIEFIGRGIFYGKKHCRTMEIRWTRYGGSKQQFYHTRRFYRIQGT